MEIKVPQINRFFKLPSPRGYQLIGFFPKMPLLSTFDLSDVTTLTGYISFRYLLNNSTPYGVLFESIKSRTEVKDYLLKVGLKDVMPDVFEPIFLLEKLGVLMFKANDSSILAIPSEISSSLLVSVE